MLLCFTLSHLKTSTPALHTQTKSDCFFTISSLTIITRFIVDSSFIRKALNPFNVISKYACGCIPFSAMSIFICAWIVADLSSNTVSPCDTRFQTESHSHTAGCFNSFDFTRQRWVYCCRSSGSYPTCARTPIILKFKLKLMGVVGHGRTTVVVQCVDVIGNKLLAGETAAGSIRDLKCSRIPPAPTHALYLYAQSHY